MYSILQVGSGRCTRFHFVKQNETLAEEIFSSIYYNGTGKRINTKMLLYLCHSSTELFKLMHLFLTY